MLLGKQRQRRTMPPRVSLVTSYLVAPLRFRGAGRQSLRHAVLILSDVESCHDLRTSGFSRS